MCSLKNDRMISVCFQGEPFNSNVSLCPNDWCRRCWSWKILWRPTRSYRTNTKKRRPFHHRRLERKSRKSWDTWSNRQVWSWSTKWSRAKGNRALPREHTGHSKHSLPTTQEMSLHMDNNRWSIPKSKWLYSCRWRWKSSIQSAITRLGAAYGSDDELHIAKFRLKLKKVGKTTRPFRWAKSLMIIQIDK